MPLKDDLKQATHAVKLLFERGEKEVYIDKCDLSDEDIEILKRVWLKRHSRVKIAREMNMAKETVQLHYRNAMIVLQRVIEKNKP